MDAIELVRSNLVGIDLRGRWGLPSARLVWNGCVSACCCAAVSMRVFFKDEWLCEVRILPLDACFKGRCIFLDSTRKAAVALGSVGKTKPIV